MSSTYLVDEWICTYLFFNLPHPHIHTENSFFSLKFIIIPTLYPPQQTQFELLFPWIKKIYLSFIHFVFICIFFMFIYFSLFIFLYFFCILFHFPPLFMNMLYAVYNVCVHSQWYSLAMSFCLTLRRLAVYGYKKT